MVEVVVVVVVVVVAVAVDPSSASRAILPYAWFKIIMYFHNFLLLSESKVLVRFNQFHLERKYERTSYSYLQPYILFVFGLKLYS